MVEVRGNLMFFEILIENVDQMMHAIDVFKVVVMLFDKNVVAYGNLSEIRAVEVGCMCWVMNMQGIP
ncbi:hypothetical protein Fmac_020646 [Flemingia macrophylla]|uniref:Uncharacterized protein n=1 Tax=Flemingia macrophylla TaxID=520843 RepID=A0ABD1LUL8_9FABA